MSKRYYCAKCGVKLNIKQKTIPQKGIVMNLIEPHVCKDEPILTDNKDVFAGEGPFEILDKKREKEVDKKVDALFDQFPFVKKLNKASAEHEVVTQEAGDKRGKSHLREELVTSSAPLNVLDSIKDRIPKK